jgi:outer membrane lipopolysaccharide assembly protein LptE/RlpB
MKQSINQRLAIMLLSLSLFGCGFKLAGDTTSLPESLGSIYLVMNNFSDRQRVNLLNTFDHAGAEIVSHPGDGSVTLSVSINTVPDRILVVSANSGKTVVRIARQLGFNLKSASGEVLVEQKTLVQQRDIELNSDTLLSSKSEKASVAEDLEKALFNLMIHQLKRI